MVNIFKDNLLNNQTPKNIMDGILLTQANTMRMLD